MSEKIETLVDVSPPKPGDEPEDNAQLSAAEQDTVRELVRAARASGAALTGPGGLLSRAELRIVFRLVTGCRWAHVHQCLDLLAHVDPPTPNGVIGPLTPLLR